MKSPAGLALPLLLALAACAGAPPVTTLPPPPPTASEPPPPLETAAPPPAAAGFTPPEPAAPPANMADAGVAAAPAPLVPICLAKCEKLVTKCSHVSVENCRLNCGRVDPPPAGCAEVVRSALECARDAHDVTCANVAPQSCAAKFLAIAACAAGTAAPAPAPVAGLPEGWEPYTDMQHGLRVPMPSGGTNPSDTVHVAHASDGTTYTVTVMPLPDAKPTQKSLLHLMMKVQGRCSDKLRLDGFIERTGRTSIHYTSRCPDKTDWDGMIYVGTQNLVLLSARAPTGKIGITEPFYYGFEFTGS